MTLTYPPKLDQVVKQELASGAFRSEEELVINALSAFREMRLRHDQLHHDVQEAIGQARRGDIAPLDIDAIKSELMNEIDDQGQPR